MSFPQTRARFVILVASTVLLGAVALVRSQQPTAKPGAGAAATKPDREKALRLNTLGVADLNQPRPGDAQKYFEQALEADSSFTVARANLGIALMAQQKLEAAKAALEAATAKLPKDPYAWYNLGLVYKDLGDAEHGVAA